MEKKLSCEICRIIKEEVALIRKEQNIINAIIRNDIFSILEERCTVLYYPLEEEEANGIHVQRNVNGVPKDFVYINTGNPIEKQVYTAAHELGHVWKVDERVKSKLNHDANEEQIINRFAAELLIPEQLFIKSMQNKIQDMNADENNVSFEVIMNLIVYLMDIFMVPFKAIVYRMEELDVIDVETNSKLIYIDKKKSQIVQMFVQKGQYLNLNQIKKKKAMGKLGEMLEKAEDKKIYSEEKIANIRNQFGIIKDEEEYEDATNVALNINKDNNCFGQ